MALVKSQTWTSISGSVGGVTWAKSAQGYYMRARTVPVQPGSTNQVQVRSALTSLVTSWTELLTPAQREGWDMYASNVLVTNPLGDAVAVSGQNWYVAANTPREQAASKLGIATPRVDDAPSIFDRGDFTTPAPDGYSEASGVFLSIGVGDAWVNEDDAAMLVFQGRPRNPSRRFFGGPYRLIGAGVGSSTAPISDIIILPGQVSNFGYPIVEGEATNIVVAVTRADGRLSTRRDLGQVIAAA